MPGFVTCGPNEALVISGCCHSKPYLMPGGRVFVWPWLQKIQRISLNTMTLSIESPNVHTKNGVPITLTGISQVKISGNNADKLLAASENFLGKTEAEIIKIVQETLEGHQREVMAKMTVEKIYVDRKDFSKQVYQVASSDLADMGLVVVSYTVKDIHDELGYLESLGLAQTAKVKADAKIAEKEEERDFKIKQSNAEKEKSLAEIRNQTQIAKAKNEFDLKKAEFDILIHQENAKSNLANELQQQISEKSLIKEKLRIELEQDFNFDEITEKKKEIKEIELKCRINELADKHYERVKIISDAEQEKYIKEGETESEVIKMIGNAQAYSLEKISKAQTDIMALQASAFTDYGPAAKINMLLDTLPKITAEICGPVAKCNKITLVSQGDGEIGVKKMVTEVLDIATKFFTSINDFSSISNVSYGPGDDAPPGHPPSIPPLERKSSALRTGYLFNK